MKSKFWYKFYNKPTKNLSNVNEFNSAIFFLNWLFIIILIFFCFMIGLITGQINYTISTLNCIWVNSFLILLLILFYFNIKLINNRIK